MKRYIHSKTTEQLNMNLLEVTSITLVADASDFSPRNFVNSISITSAKQLRKDYHSMEREDLIAELTKDQLAAIRDIEVLRKLDLEDLTLAQRVLVGQANREYSDKLSRTKVRAVLDKLKKCEIFFIWPTAKNRSFLQEIKELGGQVELSDVRNIVHSLSIEDFTDSTLSYLDTNWNSVLIIFEYKGDYTFKAIKEGGQDVTVAGLELYIKLDIDEKDGEGIGAVSFHHPEFKMSHPYKEKG